jgi:hypothetical protein
MFEISERTSRVQELTPKQRRRGFEIADQIATLAVDDPPDEFARSTLYKTVDAFRKYYGYRYKKLKAMCSIYGNSPLKTSGKPSRI